MEERDSLLYGLIISCPLHNCQKECPIQEIRNLPVRDRLTYIGKLNREDRQSLITHHRVCINEFEKKYFHITS